jgi:hypothetical protein
MEGYFILFGVLRVAQGSVLRRQRGFPLLGVRRRLYRLSRQFPYSLLMGKSTRRRERKKGIKVGRGTGRRRGKRAACRKSLIVSPVCGSSGEASNRPRTSGRKRKRGTSRARKKMSAQPLCLRCRHYKQRRRRLYSRQHRPNRTGRPIHQGQPRYGAAVVHASAITPNDCLGPTATRCSGSRMPLSLRAVHRSRARYHHNLSSTRTSSGHDRSRRSPQRRRPFIPIRSRLHQLPRARARLRSRLH